MVAQSENIQCPLCRNKEIEFYHEDTNRLYLCCLHCSLVFVPDRFWLSAQDEKGIYDLHENDSLDQGYRKFLSKLTLPLLTRLQPNLKGLDFGCGGGPALSVILEEHGYQVSLYDPFYFNDPILLKNKYDFVCATEVVEHLRNPEKEFTQLLAMLGSGGWLGLMTKLVIDQAAFRRWHYIRDLTHICFYSQATFEYLAERFNTTLEFVGRDVVLMEKQ